MRVPMVTRGWAALALRLVTKRALVRVAAVAVIALLVVGGGSAGSTAVDASTAPPSPADERLSSFLAARIAGKGVQRYLGMRAKDVPLLYATSSGARYERAEFRPVRGIEWPYGYTAFKLRLFGGRTVVEQLFFRGGAGLVYQPDGFGTRIAPTTENGRPVGVPYDLADGRLRVRVPHPWVAVRLAGSSDGLLARLIPPSHARRPTTDGGERSNWDELLFLTNPALVGCGAGPRAASAEALARSIESDTSLHATAPIAVRAGARKALRLDVVIAAGAPVRFCEGRIGLLSLLVDMNAGQAFDASGQGTGRATGERMRLYLLDAPSGSSTRVVAIAIIAPKSRFQSVATKAQAAVNSVTLGS